MKEIMEWVKDILLAVVIAAVILAFFKPIIVQQQSMEPNFHAGDYLITSRQAYRLFGDPQRGDVIVFKSELLDENEKPKNLIKRIMPEYFSTTVWDGAVDISWYDASQTAFYLDTPAKLAGLAALVNGQVDAGTPDYRIKGDRSELVSTRVDDYLLVGAGGGSQYGTAYVGQNWYLFVFFEFVIMDSPPKTMLCLYLHV